MTSGLGVVRPPPVPCFLLLRPPLRQGMPPREPLILAVLGLGDCQTGSSRPWGAPMPAAKCEARDGWRYRDLRPGRAWTSSIVAIASESPVRWPLFPEHPPLEGVFFLMRIAAGRLPCQAPSGRAVRGPGDWRCSDHRFSTQSPIESILRDAEELAMGSWAIGAGPSWRRRLCTSPGSWWECHPRVPRRPLFCVILVPAFSSLSTRAML
ncbi:hypothetical protein F5X68DRAFT_57388 [Plectosphaerella plurivora]|uniref:Uncharacterized protein n=1 Tax=Plectosphaerella plurivora TaxID=936078 RepID=A0A9P8VHQ7_9PEZI|nr:hypothetical protein F5X68DRAFT_57388 [Plectosphaerella plurivora]